MRHLAALVIALLCLLASRATAADDATIAAALLRLAAENAGERTSALAELGATRDARVLVALDDFSKNALYRWNAQAITAPVRIDQADGSRAAVPLDPLSRVALSDAVPMDTMTLIACSPRERVLVRDASTRLRLSVGNRDERLASVTRLGDGGDLRSRPLLDEVIASDPDAAVRRTAEESRLLLNLADPATSLADRVQACHDLGALGSARALPRLDAVIQAQPDAETMAAAKASRHRIENWQRTVRGVGHVFSGLSAGSILILVALGLAIAFGLMGVINMAHGELVMIGAYATFLTQKLFEVCLPASWFWAYFIAAIPLSFLLAALIGWIIEVCVVRFLYGRPLETLLATFGVALVLQQAVRAIFGDNRAVNSPSWLQGGIEVANGLVLPWARLFIIGFCAATVVGIVLLIGRTRLGLLLRATTQNRPMAAALGVRTRRIDAYAFALGAGIAGLAGCALTLISNITPSMGQELVVDSFLVVVVGGVGKIAGVVVAGLSLGGLTKIFEPFTEAVWAKALVLLAVIVFIQWKPSGLFPQKGRTADA